MDFCNIYSGSHWRYSVKVFESLFNKLAGLKGCNLIKKRLEHKCFPVKFTNFLRTPILNNICKRLLLNISNICLKDQLKLDVLIYHSSGTPCNDYNGYCDILNKCRDVDAEGPLSRLKNFLFNSQTFDNILDWMKQYWWACVLIGLGLVLLMAGKATLYLAL